MRPESQRSDWPARSATRELATRIWNAACRRLRASPTDATSIQERRGRAVATASGASRFSQRSRSGARPRAEAFERGTGAARGGGCPAGGGVATGGSCAGCLQVAAAKSVRESDPRASLREGIRLLPDPTAGGAALYEVARRGGGRCGAGDGASVADHELEALRERHAELRARVELDPLQVDGRAAERDVVGDRAGEHVAAVGETDRDEQPRRHEQVGAELRLEAPPLQADHEEPERRLAVRVGEVDVDGRAERGESPRGERRDAVRAGDAAAVVDPGRRRGARFADEDVAGTVGVGGVEVVRAAVEDRRPPAGRKTAEDAQLVRRVAGG